MPNCVLFMDHWGRCSVARQCSLGGRKAAAPRETRLGMLAMQNFAKFLLQVQCGPIEAQNRSCPRFLAARPLVAAEPEACLGRVQYLPNSETVARARLAPGFPVQMVCDSDDPILFNACCSLLMPKKCGLSTDQSRGLR